MLHERKHSTLGLISVLVSIFAWTILISIILFFGYLEEFTPGGIDAVRDGSPTAIIMVILFFVSLLFSLVGLILGIIGLFNRQRNRLLCFLGIIFSLSLFALWTVILILGTSAN
jgi:hypothetical protein